MDTATASHSAPRHAKRADTPDVRRFFVVLSPGDGDLLERRAGAENRTGDQQATYVVRRWLRRNRDAGDAVGA
jgi:hypothetical protein